MIYLDHNATSPVLPCVRKAMEPFLCEEWGNPSSSYRLGASASAAIHRARNQVAETLNCDPSEVVFTGSATEAINTALHAAVFAGRGERRIVTSCVEHSAVLSYCAYLEQVHGVEITRLGVDPYGRLDIQELEGALRREASIVSLMWGNNETGVLFPIEEIAGICAARRVPLHCDAVQAAGKIPVDFAGTSLTYMSISGHKFGAPKGVGALIIRRGAPFVPLIHGGKQQSGRRGGTESVPLVVGLGEACAWIGSNGPNHEAEWRKLRDDFEAKLRGTFPDVEIRGQAVPRLPNTSNFRIPSLDGDAVVTYLDRYGICVSSGSACMEEAIAPSHVILAMTGCHESAAESVRVSLGTENTADELSLMIQRLEELRRLTAHSERDAIN